MSVMMALEIRAGVFGCERKRSACSATLIAGMPLVFMA